MRFFPNFVQDTWNLDEENAAEIISEMFECEFEQNYT